MLIACYVANCALRHSVHRDHCLDHRQAAHGKPGVNRAYSPLTRWFRQLLFDPFESIVLFLTVLTVNYVVADGKSNWLEGMSLNIR